MLPLILYCAIVLAALCGVIFHLLGVGWLAGALLGAALGCMVGVFTAGMCNAASRND